MPLRKKRAAPTQDINTGFTLIELVMVIIIISLIAAATLPRYVNLKSKANESSDKTIMGALNTAIRLANVSLVTQTGDNTFPNVNPFTLLELTIPNSSVTYQQTITPDNQTWRTWFSGYQGWYLMCPHFDGTVYYSSGSVYDSQTKGYYIVYNHIDCTYSYGIGSTLKPAGSFWVLCYKSH